MTTPGFYKTLDEVTRAHAQQCGAAIVMYLLNPADFKRLQLEDGEKYRGAEVRPEADVPKDIVRVRCANGHGSPLGAAKDDDINLDLDAWDFQRQQTERQVAA